MMPIPKNPLATSLEPITTKEIKTKVYLLHVYSNEDSKIPVFVAVQRKTQGVAFGTIYQSGQNLWLGKIGKMPGGKWDVSLRLQKLKEMNEEVIFEKIAYDLYQKLGRDAFLLPKTLLSEQNVLDQFQLDDRLVSTWKIEKTLRIMSLIEPDFIEFSTARTFGEKGIISFMDFLYHYHRPPAHILTPDGRPVPLHGFLEMLAVGKMLADKDILGRAGKNAGFI